MSRYIKRINYYRSPRIVHFFIRFNIDNFHETIYQSRDWQDLNCKLIKQISLRYYSQIFFLLINRISCFNVYLLLCCKSVTSH